MRGGSLRTEGTRCFILRAILSATFKTFDKSVYASDLTWNVDLLRTFDGADTATGTSVSLSQAWNRSVVADQIGSSVLCILAVFLVIVDESLVHALVVVGED